MARNTIASNQSMGATVCIGRASAVTLGFRKKNILKFTGLNHLAMVTGDMDATIRFWRDLLGMRLIGGFGEAGFRPYFFEIDDKHTIAFFEWNGAQAIERKLHGEPFEGPIVFDHISFGMESSDETEKLKNKLETAGFECSDMIDHGFIHSVYSFDPNGIPLEFCYCH